MVLSEVDVDPDKLTQENPPVPQEVLKKEDAKPADAAAEADEKVASEVEIEEMDTEGGEATAPADDVPMQT